MSLIKNTLVGALFKDVQVCKMSTLLLLVDYHVLFILSTKLMISSIISCSCLIGHHVHYGGEKD